jgi:ABC-type cobalamin/Fe3+-siderophores transport system ATPase subunit
MTKIAEIENCTVSYRENIALKNTSLGINEGTFLAVIGPNGAGKTTLLTVINGLGKIISGSVKIFGLELTTRNINKIRKEIGYVPQSSAIDPRSPICVSDVVMIGRLAKIGLLRHLDTEDREIVESVMDLVGISELKERPIGHLSGGEQQKVAIARALAQQPKILLLDEPTANLDIKAQRDIIDLIERIYTEQDLTIIFVTHILSHIPSSCKEAVLMKQGKIVWTGKLKDALQDELLSDVYDYPVKAKELQL